MRTVEIAGRAVAVDLPFARVDFAKSADPITEILRSAEFEESSQALLAEPTSSLMGYFSRALFYSIVRNQQPENVVEIGTFLAGTSEIFCRALFANGFGALHTIDPYGGERVPPVLAGWEDALRRHLFFYPITSARFFGEAMLNGLKADLVFIDGNHEYEFALFDIQCAARLLKPGGLMCIDNIEQPGPFFAARDFLAANPFWRPFGNAAPTYRTGHPHDPARIWPRYGLPMILRAPDHFNLGSRPVGTALQTWEPNTVRAFTFNVLQSSGGTLHAQCVFRSLASKREEPVQRLLEIPAGFVGRMQLDFDFVFSPADTQRMLEPWFSWEGERDLVLAAAPVAVAKD